MYLNRIHTATFLPFRAYNTDNQLITDTGVDLDMAVVTCLAVIPPELGKDNFGLPAKILYVPAGSVEVYRKNAVWREAFETIAALP